MDRRRALNRLTRELLRKLMSDLTAAGYAPETVAKTMRWVRLTLNQAVRDRRIAVSPAEGVRLPKVCRSEIRQTRLGHSSIQVTIDRYGHLMDGLDDRTAARLDEIARAARGRGVTEDVSRG